MRTTLRTLFPFLALLLAACGGGSGDTPAAKVDPVARLSSLELSGVTLSPAFAVETFAYTAEVPSTTVATTLTATASSSGLSLSLGGEALTSGVPSAPQTLVAGDNSFEVVVATANGTETRTYTVTVRRAYDAVLTDLALSTGELSPSFDPAVTSYTATVGYLAPDISVTASAAAPGASLTVNGNSVASGQASAPVALTAGSNTVVVVTVTLSPGVTRDYFVIATRETSNTFAQRAYAKASNTSAGDQFGWRVAVSGDTLAVGAPEEDSSATGIDGNQTDNSADAAGAVYVFRRDGATWSQQAYLKASNTDSGDRFGSWLAIDGDTLVVAAPYEDGGAAGINGNQADNSAADAGAVYVFIRNGTTWTQQAYIKGSNTGYSDFFGGGLALSGDTMVVGARYEDSGASGIGGDQGNVSVSYDSGAAYVFTRTGATWTQQAYIKASNAGEGDWFGFEVAIDGDTMVVGATKEDGVAQDSGAAYVFQRSGTAWTQQAIVKAANPDPQDAFGGAVAVSGDTIAVGASGEDSNSSSPSNNGTENSGAVYVFQRTGTAWPQQAYIKASNVDLGDRFGVIVQLSGEFLAVGAPYEDSAATGVNGSQSNGAGDAGAVYVLRRVGTTWSPLYYVKASNTGSGDLFYSVALSGDTLVGGAYQEDSSAIGVGGNQGNNGATDAGAVYVLR